MLRLETQEHTAGRRFVPDISSHKTADNQLVLTGSQGHCNSTLSGVSAEISCFSQFQ